MTVPDAPVSPKVTAATLTAATTTVVLWLLTLVPVVDEAPAPVMAALALLLVGGPTFLAGYWRTDPLRSTGGEHRAT